MNAKEFIKFFDTHFSFSSINQFKWHRHNVELYETVFDQLNAVLLNDIKITEPYNRTLLIQIINLINRKNSYSYKRKQANAFISKPEVRKFVFERDNNKCVKCPATENLTVDHIISVYNGGNNYYSNLQTLCKKCNCKKNYN